MKTLRWLSWLSVLILILGGRASGASPVNWQDKVDPRVLQDVGANAGEFILFLDEQADLSGAERLATKAEKGRYVYERLTALAERTQGLLLDRLDALAKANPGQVTYRPFWVANMIWVRGDQQALQALAQQPEVAQVFANPQIRQDLPEPLPETPDAPRNRDGLEDEPLWWGIARVKAPEVWALGITGQGVVIGGQDTGYAWEHPALKNKYRGWNGTTANHNYSWHDAIHTGVSSCAPDSPAPCDDDLHGTHTMGTMVGDDGQGKQIGMAPGARWIGCRNMREGIGTPATYAECYQWFIAPTDLNGQNPRTDLAPDVINNSWSCPVGEGCTDKQVLLATVNAVRAAGIVTVHSAGNEGSQCGTIQNPAAIYDASFTVGNTNQADQMASNSSRGPVTVDGSNRLKPDISAPGTSIYSSVPSSFPPGYSYTTLSGTSMAGPHVAGLVALIISANPSLRGNVDRLEDLIRLNAQPLSLLQNQICGGVSANQIPNNIFGWGRIDALKTIQAIDRIELRKTVSSLLYTPGDQLTYTLWYTHTHPTSLTTNVVITDTLPDGVDFVSASSPYDRAGSLVSWQFPTLDPGETGSVQLVVEIPQDPALNVTNAAYGVGSDDYLMLLPPPQVISYLALETLRFPLIFR